MIFNETFAPLAPNSAYPSINILWHEGMQGRKAPSVIQALDVVLTRAAETGAQCVTLWCDNCFAQLKNFYTATYIVNKVNSSALETINLKYLVSGHTYMAADSVHGNIESALNRRGPIYSFDSLLQVVASNRKNNIAVFCETFLEWQKLKKSKMNKKIDSSKAVQLTAKKGHRTVFCRYSFHEPELEIDFLQKRAKLPLQPNRLPNRGVNKKKLELLKKVAFKFMSPLDKRFWNKLKGSDTKDLGQFME